MLPDILKYKNAPLSGAFFYEKIPCITVQYKENSLENQLKLLIKIQAIDTQIQKSEEIKKKYYDDIEAIEHELTGEEGTFAKQKEELQNLEKEHRRLERALDDVLGRRGKAQDKLFSIKTNKEYQAALQEIEGIKESVKKQEDEILEIMEQMESLRGALKKNEEHLKKTRAEYAQKKKQVEEALNQYLQDIEGQKEKREALVKEINPQALRDYTILREAKHGLAVVMTRNELCLGCNMKIPPQIYNLVITGDDIIHCPSCRRILYIEHEPEQKKTDTGIPGK